MHTSLQHPVCPFKIHYSIVLSVRLSGTALAAFSVPLANHHICDHLLLFSRLSGWWRPSVKIITPKRTTENFLVMLFLEAHQNQMDRILRCLLFVCFHRSLLCSSDSTFHRGLWHFKKLIPDPSVAYVPPGNVTLKRLSAMHLLSTVLTTAPVSLTTEEACVLQLLWQQLRRYPNTNKTFYWNTFNKKSQTESILQTLVFERQIEYANLWKASC